MGKIAGTTENVIFYIVPEQSISKLLSTIREGYYYFKVISTDSKN